jgi:hypothetical protein
MVGHLTAEQFLPAIAKIAKIANIAKINKRRVPEGSEQEGQETRRILSKK